MAYTSPHRFRRYHSIVRTSSTEKKKAQVSQSVFFVSCFTSRSSVFAISSSSHFGNISARTILPPEAVATAFMASGSDEALSSSRSCSATMNCACTG